MSKNSEDIYNSWPQWKKDIHICGSKILIGSELICNCTHPERVKKIRDQERIDRKQYSYWPEVSNEKM